MSKKEREKMRQQKEKKTGSLAAHAEEMRVILPPSLPKHSSKHVGIISLHAFEWISNKNYKTPAGFLQ